MKQRIVGTYYMGSEQAQLVLREGTGGEFFTCPEVGSVPRIKIGADQSRWSDVVSLLLHEVIEFQMLRNFARYSPCGFFGNDHAEYLFVITPTSPT
jgi:hypothetical protein